LYIVLAIGLVILKKDSRQGVRGLFLRAQTTQAVKKH
jgi:hypothetical protein